MLFIPYVKIISSVNHYSFVPSFPIFSYLIMLAWASTVLLKTGDRSKFLVAIIYQIKEVIFCIDLTNLLIMKEY